MGTPGGHGPDRRARLGAVDARGRLTRPLAAGTLLGVLVLVALHLWRGVEYWNFSEGVYAYTSRQLLEGADVYGTTFAAQPPWQFLVGAGVLAIHDGLEWLRLAVGIVQLGTGVLTGVVVWRLTGRTWATVLAVPLALLAPWTVHEHGALTPELLAPPLLLGAVLLAARPQTAVWAGLLAGLTPFVKWPFALAVIAIVVCSAAPRRALMGATAVIAAQLVGFTVVFGWGLWDDTVIAQLGSGRRGLGVLLGIWGQAAWSLVGLVIAAGLAWWRRAQLRDEALVRVAAGLAVAMVLTLVTNTKEGTGLNVLVPIEAALVPLAVAALTLVSVRVLAGVLLAFTLAQTASLVLSPVTRTPFIYPGSQRNAWGRVADEAEVRRLVRVGEACPPGVPYAGAPFLAFLADRPMPAGQPDQFLPAKSPHLADVQRRIVADQPRCG